MRTALLLALLVTSTALAQGYLTSPGAATATKAGVVTTTAQTFAGAKTFGDNVIFNGNASCNNGWGNGGSGASQGIQFSGSNTFVVGAGDTTTVGLTSNSGSVFGRFTLSGLVTTPAVLPLKRSFFWMPPLNNSTAFNAVGSNAWAVTGTPTAAPAADATLMMVKYTSGASTGNTAGVTGSALGNSRFGFAPRMTFVVRTDSAITNQRIFIGLSSNDPSGISTLAGLNGNFVGLFRYDTGLSDTNWMAVTSDGTTASATSTGVAVAANTTYILTVDFFQSGHAKFVINSALSPQVDKTTNIPVGATDVGPCASLTTLANTAQALYIGRAQQDQN